MASQNYQHQIIRWNGTDRQVAKYQLQLVEIGQNGQAIYRARWRFDTFKGLLSFVQKNFPDSDLLHQVSTQSIQFRVATVGSEG